MSNAKAIAQQFLETFQSKDFSAWTTLASDDLSVAFPYAPPPFPKGIQGRAAFEGLVTQFFASFSEFKFVDVKLYATDDPERAFATARSEAVLQGGKPYSNDYVLTYRVRNGKLIEYAEYFDPAKAQAAFS